MRAQTIREKPVVVEYNNDIESFLGLTGPIEALPNTPTKASFQVGEKVLDEADFAANIIRNKVNQDSIIVSKNPVPRVKKATQMGTLIVSFSEPIQQIDLDLIDLSTLEYEEQPRNWQPALTVHVEPSEEQDPANVQLSSFNVTSITPNEMQIQMYFKTPLLVSYGPADTVVVAFHDANLFISQNGGYQILEEDRTLKRKLMRQVPAEDF